jgi:enoyl-[acyl-carrier-protein] reductase (NADH)
MEKKIALVTGGNKGLGKEVVRQLAKCGMTVYLGSRDVGRGEAAARSLVDEGLEVIPLRVDVTDNESAESAASELRRVHGRLDVLVNRGYAPTVSTTFPICWFDSRYWYALTSQCDASSSATTSASVIGLSTTARSLTSCKTAGTIC